jgi:hypothetical protein
VRNDEFVITGEKTTRIAEAFAVDPASVNGLWGLYKNLAGSIKNLYLAHITRAMEHYFRGKTGNPLFIVSCEPYRVHVPGQKDCGAYYVPGKRFVIFFNSALDEREIRVKIAHELGHLFLLASYDLKDGRKMIPLYDHTMEPLSSIFGIFVISDKNDFYQNAAGSPRNHPDWNAVLSDFAGLSKK